MSIIPAAASRIKKDLHSTLVRFYVSLLYIYVHRFGIYIPHWLDSMDASPCAKCLIGPIYIPHWLDSMQEADLIGRRG